MHSSFFIRCNNRYVKINLQDILYLEAKKNYVQVVTIKEKHLALISLRQLEAELPPSLFCRVHRSFIVSLNHIAAFDHLTVQIEKKQIPISEQFRDVLPGRVKIISSETRKKKSVSKVNVDSLLN